MKNLHINCRIFQTNKHSVPNTVNTTNSYPATESCSQITDQTTVVSSEALEWKRKFEEAEQKLKNKGSKRQKRLEKKTAMLRMKDVEEKDHLPVDKQYLVRSHVRKTIWQNLKVLATKFRNTDCGKGT